MCTIWTFSDVYYQSMWCILVGNAQSLRPVDIGNQARVLLVEFIRQRMVSAAGLETPLEEDLLISPDSSTGRVHRWQIDHWWCTSPVALLQLTGDLHAVRILCICAFYKLRCAILKSCVHNLQIPESWPDSNPSPNLTLCKLHAQLARYAAPQNVCQYIYIYNIFCN